MFLFVAFCLVKLAISAKPHILLVAIDDLGFTDVGFNNAEYKTPTLDNLVNTGIKLTNYHVHLDCSPTRSAILTGQYSFKNGLQSINTIPPGTTEHIPFENPTIAELLKKDGYSTNMIGKWHLGYAAWNMTPTGRGFDSYLGYMQGAEDYYTHDIQGGYDFWYNKNIDLRANNTYGCDLYTNEINRIINNFTNNANDDDSLFVYAAFQTIHTPIENPPNNFTECNNINDVNRKVYCNQILYLDSMLGKIIENYKINNLWNNTVLFLTTDNGGMPYWSTTTKSPLVVSWGCNEPLRAGKATLFEGGVRGVGFINGGNNIIPTNLRGTTSNVYSHAIDILPTLLEGFAGITLPNNIPFDGMNMWNSINGNKEWERDILYLDIENNGDFAAIKDISTGWKLIKGTPLYDAWFPCINGNYTPYGNQTLFDLYLFNITEDPNETTNLAYDNPDVVQYYTKMIQNFIDNGGYMPEQDAQIHPNAFPAFHNGIWTPWLD